MKFEIPQAQTIVVFTPIANDSIQWQDSKNKSKRINANA